MPTRWFVEAGGETRAQCKKCGRDFQRRDQRLRMYQAASPGGSAYVNCRWHVNCVPENTARQVHASEERVYQQLRAAQEEERHRAREERAAAERQPGQAGIRRFFGARGGGGA